MCHITLYFEHCRGDATIQEFWLWRSGVSPLKLDPKFSAYAHAFFCIWTPPQKRWNQSTGVLISFDLLIWFGPIYTYFNQSLLFSLSFKEEDPIPTLEKGLWMALKLFFLILLTGPYVTGWPLAQVYWLPFSQSDLNQGNTFLSEQRQMGNSSNQSCSPQTAKW